MDTTLFRGRRIVVGVMFLLTAAACGGGASAPEEERDQTADVAPGNIRVGAFNMENFGPTKAGRPTTVNAYAKIVLEYDALVLQEIEDSSGDAPNVLLREVNRISPKPYALALSGRLGRTSAKEQYGLIYRPDRASLVSTYQVEDPEDEFEREPFAFTIQHGAYTYGLIALHAKPDDAVGEIDKAAFAYDAYRNQTGIESAFVLGDLNADCDYATDSALRATALCSDSRFSWLIPDSADTTTTTTVCAYDRIVVRGPIATKLLSPAVYRFDQHLAVSGESVSDHFPVEVEVGDSGGDYTGFTCAPQAGANEAPPDERSSGRFLYSPGGSSGGGSGSGSSGDGGSQSCCRVCTTGKACGDSCISRDSTCHIGAGCACNG